MSRKCVIMQDIESHSITLNMLFLMAAILMILNYTLYFIYIYTFISFDLTLCVFI